MVGIAARMLGAGFVVAAVSGIAAADEPGAASWTHFRSDEGRFEVTLPRSPVRETISRDTWLGAVTESKYSAERDGTVFAVEHHDLPRAAATLVPAGAILRRARNGILADEDGRELAWKDCTLAGREARELTYEVPGDPPYVEKLVLLLVGSRLYIVGAGSSETDPRDHHTAFFDSFHLLSPEVALRR